MAKKKDSTLAMLLERGADIAAKILSKTAEVLSDEDNQKKAKNVANEVSEQTTDAAKFVKKKIEEIKEKKETAPKTPVKKVAAKKPAPKKPAATKPVAKSAPAKKATAKPASKSVKS